MRLDHYSHDISSRIDIPQLLHNILDDAHLLLVLLFRISMRTAADRILHQQRIANGENEDVRIDHDSITQFRLSQKLCCASDVLGGEIRSGVGASKNDVTCWVSILSPRIS